MPELRRGPGLAPEPLLSLRVAGGLRPDVLDRDRAVEAPVVGPVDLSHASPAEQVVEAVRADGFDRRWAHRVILQAAGRIPPSAIGRAATGASYRPP